MKIYFRSNIGNLPGAVNFQTVQLMGFLYWFNIISETKYVLVMLEFE